MKKIGVVTGSRADYRYIYWILKEIEKTAGLRLQLFVTGMHLSSEFGLTYQEILKDGFKIHKKIKMLSSLDTQASISKSTATGMLGFTKALSSDRPDLLVVTGDRFEMFSAASSAMLMCIPIAHIGGGEKTMGSMDETIRHCLTKMSHLHFCSNYRAKQTIIQMGEEPKMVYNFGSTGLEDFYKIKPLKRRDFCKELEISPDLPIMFVAYHPVTMKEKTKQNTFKDLLKAIKEYPGHIIITGSNADAKGREINKMARDFAKENKNAKVIINFGREKYASLLKWADIMVGNSSSGLCEAPTFRLPVVNIGDRQKGRLRGKNVIDVGTTEKEIREGIKKTFSSRFRKTLTGSKNPYYKGRVAHKIVQVLEKTEFKKAFLEKGFRVIL